MQLSIINFYNSVIAEFFKIKRTPIIWIVLLTGSIVGGFHMLDYNFGAPWNVNLDTNPWTRYLNLSSGMLACFIFTPFIVLLISSIVNIEHKSNTWKYLYSLPLAKGDFHFSKLIVAITLMIITLLIFVAGLFTVAYILHLLHPEYEFNFHQPDLSRLISVLLRLLIAVSAIVGFQYWLSLKFKNYIIPMGIGIGLFIAGIIFSVSNTPYSMYFPFSYPFLYHDFKMLPVDKVGIESFGWLNNMECYSLLVFLFFIGLSYFESLRKSVH